MKDSFVIYISQEISTIFQTFISQVSRESIKNVSLQGSANINIENVYSFKRVSFFLPKYSFI